MRMRIIGFVALGGVLAGTTGVATGQHVTLTAVGEVDSVQTNPFGISAGDPFAIVAMYESSLLTNLGPESVDLGEETGHSFNLDVANGTLVRTALDDVFYDLPDSDPEVRFVDGAFTGFNFVSNEFAADGGLYEVASFSGADPSEPDLDIFSILGKESVVIGSFTGVSVSPE